MGQRLYADYQKLYDYGAYLHQKALEFQRIRTKMQEIILNIQSNWDGNDARAFIANSIQYLDNLSIIEKDLASFGAYVRGQVLNYDKKELAFQEDFNKKVDYHG